MYLVLALASRGKASMFPLSKHDFHLVFTVDGRNSVCSQDLCQLLRRVDIRWQYSVVCLMYRWYKWHRGISWKSWCHLGRMSANVVHPDSNCKTRHTGNTLTRTHQKSIWIHIKNIVSYYDRNEPRFDSAACLGEKFDFSHRVRSWGWYPNQMTSSPKGLQHISQQTCYLHNQRIPHVINWDPSHRTLAATLTAWQKTTRIGCRETRTFMHKASKRGMQWKNKQDKSFFDFTSPKGWKKRSLARYNTREGTWATVGTNINRNLSSIPKPTNPPKPPQ